MSPYLNNAVVLVTITRCVNVCSVLTSHVCKA